MAGDSCQVRGSDGSDEHRILMSPAQVAPRHATSGPPDVVRHFKCCAQEGRDVDEKGY